MNAEDRECLAEDRAKGKKEDALIEMQIVESFLKSFVESNQFPVLQLIAKHEHKVIVAYIKELTAQLPAGMQDCTILFKECEKGHGRLTATNWIQHGCDTCKIQELTAQLDAKDQDLKRLCELAVADGISTGHADTAAEFAEELLANLIELTEKLKMYEKLVSEGLAILNGEQE